MLKKVIHQSYIFANYRKSVLNIEKMKEIDQSRMYQVYDDWPEIAEKSFKRDIEKVDIENVPHIVFAGMGGSGTIGDVFSSILSKTDIHVDVVKGYHLPKTVKTDSLLVCTSVSGNTIETNTILKEGIDLGCKIIAFSNNGKFIELCKGKNIEHRKILMNHSPRASFVSYLYSMIKVLSPILPISYSDVTESINGLKEIKREISSENISEKNPSLNLAQWIQNVPIIYYPFGLQSAAIRFKNSVQENAKMHSMMEDIIEASHNGIVPWEKASSIQPILITGEDDYIKTKERWQIIKEFFHEKNISYWEINSSKGNILTKLTRLIYMLDFSSIYLAILRDINPTPVSSIDLIKKRLEQL